MFKRFTEFNIKTGIDKIECFGVSLDNEKVIQMKCYKWVCKEDKKTFKDKCYCKLLDTIEKENLGYLFDYTKEVYNNKIVYRASCKIKSCSIYNGVKLLEKLKTYLDNSSYEKLITFYNLVCKCLKAEKSPLVEVGIKFIEGESIFDIKIYYSLRKFEGVGDILGKIMGFNENINLFNKVFAFFDVNKLKQSKIIAISKNLEKNGYLPTLFGIDKNYYGIICKIYYELTDYEERILKLNNKLKQLFTEISAYMNICTEKLYEIVLYYEKIDFYLRGIAFDFTLRNNYLKLYFYHKE